MSIRRRALLLGLTALGACRAESPVADPEMGPVEVNGGQPAESSLPDADINASLGPLGAEPAGPLEPSYTGLWATETSGCSSRAWRFEADRLTTPAGSVCEFRQVRSVAGGYDIEASCTAEGPETEDTLHLRFAESAGGMLFESNLIADAGLVRCSRGSRSGADQAPG